MAIGKCLPDGSRLTDMPHSPSEPLLAAAVGPR
jgi:hypothetical protein